MGSSPKIMVLRFREIIYTLILAFFVIMLIVCLILMFTKKGENAPGITQDKANDTYIAGIYTSTITLGGSHAEVQVAVNSDRIQSIELVNLDETIEAAYPLVTTCLEDISAQILEKQKLEGITCSTENRYTSQLLLNAVSEALTLARDEL
ncbi:MAG: hypothetical protein LUH07_06375 [Lachnospiraceae bacterium]|nr:hypothetical protein [Lachnospiraceae bacterium]